MSDFQLLQRSPTVEEYQQLRKAVGWYVVNNEATEQGLQNSLYSVCLVHGETVVGCGRIVGDSGIYFYLQDIIVLPEFQGKGGGRMIMDRMMQFLKSHAAPNAFVGLMAAKDVAGFYEQYGFSRRPADRPGMFIVWKDER